MGGPRFHQVHERAPAGAKYIILSHIFSIVTKVTAREGKPILIVEEGDTETCKWAEHSLEVPRAVDALQGVLTVIPLQLLSYHLAVLRLTNKKSSFFTLVQISFSGAATWIAQE